MGTKTISATMLSLLCIPVGAHANDWVELRSDAPGSRASTETSGTSFKEAWTYTAKHGGHLLASPLSVDGVVIAAGTGGDLAALGLQDGQERWAQVVDGGIGSTPAFLHGRLVASTLGGQLYGLDAKSGAINWQKAFGTSMNYSSATLVDDGNGGAGSVVLPAGSPLKEVSRIDLATGETTWVSASDAIVDVMYTSAAISGQQAIVGMNGGRYQSLDLQTGETRWTFNAVGLVNFSSPLVVDDTVYMFPGDSKSQLFAAKVADGQPVSGFPIAIPDPAPVVPTNGMLGRGPATSAPMTVGGLIIFQMRRQDMQNNPDRTFKVAMREYVVAVDPKQLKVVWQHAVGNVVAPNVNGVPELGTCPTPAAFSTPTGPVIAVSSSIAARVAVLDVATGEERWSAPLSSPGRSSPVFSNGMLLVGTDSGVLHAFSSMDNQAPAAPTGLVAGNDAASGDVTLSWTAGSDPEGQAVSYVVTVTDDSAAPTTTERATMVGETTMSFPAKASTSYHVSVRGRDSKGALSSSSMSQTVKTSAPVAAPAVATAPPAPAPSAVPTAEIVAPAAACAPPAPAAIATTTAADVTSVPSAEPPAAAPVAAVPAPVHGRIVTVFADEPAQPAVDVSATASAPAAGSNALPSVPGMAMAMASPVQALAVLASAPSAAMVDDGTSSNEAALANGGGCSVAGAGHSSGGTSVVGLGLALACLLGRKRGARRN